MWLPSSATLLLRLLCVFAALAASTADDDDDHVVPRGLFGATGVTHVYAYATSTSFEEQPAAVAAASDGSDRAGIWIDADVHVATLWSAGDVHVLRVRLVRSNASSPHLAEGACDLIWRRGRVQLLSVLGGPVATDNLLRAVAALLQFRIGSTVQSESDPRGRCTARYERLPHDSHASVWRVRKTKRDCAPVSVGREQYTARPSLSSALTTDALITYTFVGDDDDGDRRQLQSVISVERDELRIRGYDSLRVAVLVTQSLSHVETITSNAADRLLQADSVENALRLLHVSEPSDVLEISVEPSSLVEHETAATRRGFKETVDAHRDALKKMGTVEAARAMVALVRAARSASHGGNVAGIDDMHAALTHKRNKDITEQLLDVLAFAQTTDAHEAAMRHIRLDNAKQAGNAERYLWALSMGARPQADVITDLLHRYKHTLNIPPHVDDTLIASLGSMARNLRKMHTGHDSKVYAEVQSTIVNYLDATPHSASADSGMQRARYLRALLNLRSPTTLARLLEIVAAKKTPAKESVLAWRTVYSTLVDLELDGGAPLLAQPLADDVYRRARRTLLQLDKREDSSARTHAFDVLLHMSLVAPNATDVLAETMDVVVQLLTTRANVGAATTRDEIKQYVLQRLTSDARLSAAFFGHLAGSPHAANYDALSRHGLSVAMRRTVYANFAEAGVGSEGALGTVQEISRGFVKRGLVSVTLRTDEARVEEEMFGLGIFTSGLDDLMSSGDTDGEAASSSEPASAGMQLSVLGAQLRPFVFFVGQGELMSHVWSGTASDRTTAYQALALLHDDERLVRLGNGRAMRYVTTSAVSFDLAGQCTISLWYRNAEAKVEKTAGVYLTGSARLASSHDAGGGGGASVDFSLSAQPRIELAANVDFSSSAPGGGAQLCMRLSQPPLDCTQRVRVATWTDASGARAHAGRERRLRWALPAKTFALDRKNAEMCNVIFNQ